MMRECIIVATLQLPFAIWIKRTHCSLVARFILRILLIVLSSFLFASFGLKKPSPFFSKSFGVQVTRIQLRVNFENGKQQYAAIFEERIA
jgi:hypothetical protein